VFGIRCQPAQATGSGYQSWQHTPRSRLRKGMERLPNSIKHQDLQPELSVWMCPWTFSLTYLPR
jgi:hypothetical protein